MDYLVYGLSAISMLSALFSPSIPPTMGLWRLAPYVQGGCAVAATLEKSFTPLIIGFVVNNLIAAYWMRGNRNLFNKNLAPDISGDRPLTNLSRESAYFAKTPQQQSRQHSRLEHNNNPNEEDLFSAAISELDSDSRRLGLWAKCYAMTDGSEQEAKAMYIRERVDQLRTANIATNTNTNNLREYGLTEDDIIYLGAPIMAIHYLKKYETTRKTVEKAIALGKIKSLLCRDVLWVEDKPIR